MSLLRAAAPDDVATIHDFICQLAAYELEPDAVKMTIAQLHDALFGARPRGEALIVEADGMPIGMAIWSETFNTWTGRPGMYLEDFFLLPEARGQGVGQTVFRHLARVATARGYHRLEWLVLDWNESAIGFYRKMGAEPLSEWTKYRLTGEALAELAA